MVSLKPNVQEYLNFNIGKLSTEEETYARTYETYNENPNFMGLYFNPIIILYSPNLKGNFNANWYNVFYNIDTWYKVQE